MRVFLKGLFYLALAASSMQLSAKTLTPALRLQMQANLARGDLLYEYDQAAWHITDAMFAAIPDTLKTLLRGYIITPDGDDYRATFYGVGENREFAIYSATWTGKDILRPILYTDEPRPSVSSEEHRLIAARNLATTRTIFETLRFCNDRTPNVAVIPGLTAADPISVYVMTPQTENGIWPLGGHYRIDVKDGRIVGQRAFTKSCISLGGGAKPNEKVVMMTVTHSLDPIPTEIHAFTVHTSGIPIQVVTSESSFALGREKGKITVVQDK